MKGDKKSALADFNKALEYTPNDIASLSNRAYLLYSMGEYRASIADCDKLLKLQPSYGLAYCVRGLSRQGLGQYRIAISDLRNASKLSPNDFKLKESIMLLEGMLEAQKDEKSTKDSLFGNISNIFKF